MKQLNHMRATTLFAVAALAATGYACAARATVFEHKWVAGQRLSYDVSLSDSQLNLAGSKNAPTLPMGIPLNIALTADGAIDFDTQSVAEDGTGIVAMRVPKLQINASAMMMNAIVRVQDGKGRLSLNGKEMGDAEGFDVSAMTSPPMALKIGKGGNVLGFVPLSNAASTRAAKSDKKSSFPLDVRGVMQNAMIHVMPQLWPARDIKTGESWSVEPKMALPGVATPSSLGKVDLKLVGAEKIDGRDVQRVSLSGELNLTRDMAQAMAMAKMQSGLVHGGALGSMKQVVSGDIWFDAAAGQMVRTIVKVRSQSEGSGTRRASGDNEGAPAKWSSSQEFGGTLRLDLRGVSVIPGTALTVPAPAATAPKM